MIYLNSGCTIVLECFGLCILQEHFEHIGYGGIHQAGRVVHGFGRARRTSSCCRLWIRTYWFTAAASGRSYGRAKQRRTIHYDTVGEANSVRRILTKSILFGLSQEGRLLRLMDGWMEIEEYVSSPSSRKHTLFYELVNMGKYKFYEA